MVAEEQVLAALRESAGVKGELTGLTAQMAALTDAVKEQNYLCNQVCVDVGVLKQQVANLEKSPDVENLSKRVEACESNIKGLWGRSWQILFSIVGTIIGAAVVLYESCGKAIQAIQIHMGALGK